MGVNLYGDVDTIVEQYGEKVCSDRINIPSAFMDKLSEVQITTEDLDRIKKAKIKVTELEDGSGLQVTQLHIRSIKAASLEKADLEVINKKTGETRHFEMGRVIYPNNPAKFSNQVVIDGTSADFNDLTMKIYFTVKGIDHYLINTWNYSEEEQMWIPE
jgi:phosphoglycerol transferase